MSYTIFKNVVSLRLCNALLRYAHINNDTRTLVENYDTDSTMFGKSKVPNNGPCRKHTSVMVLGSLRDIFENTVLTSIDLSNIVSIKAPTLGPDILINTYNPGDFVLMHTDPPTTMWGPDRLLRLANFSCVLSNNYTGGELQVVDDIVPKVNVGDVVVFAQPQPHEVHPVQSGQRIVAFGWIYDTGVTSDAS